METDQFTDYIERGLAFEASFGQGGSDAIKAMEDILWELHGCGSLAAGMLLADRLIDLRNSFSRRDIEVVPFARALAHECFEQLLVLGEKSHWDWYALGCAHASGRGTVVAHAEAARCFQRAWEAGNAYAGYEAIWEAYLGGGTILAAIHGFRAYEGRLKSFAETSLASLGLIALGPAREIGSYSHAWRIHEITRIMRVFLYHTAGSRRINVEIEAELRVDLESLEAMGSAPSASMVLYLIAKYSRRNPTSKPALEWLRQAMEHDSPEFLALLRLQEPVVVEMRMIADACAASGCHDSALAHFATEWLRVWEEDDLYDYE